MTILCITRLKQYGHPSLQLRRTRLQKKLLPHFHVRRRRRLFGACARVVTLEYALCAPVVRLKRRRNSDIRRHSLSPVLRRNGGKGPWRPHVSDDFSTRIAWVAGKAKLYLNQDRVQGNV